MVLIQKDFCYRQRRGKEVIYDDCVLKDSLSLVSWHIEEGPKVEYEKLLRGLRDCADRASKPGTTKFDRISKTTKELFERRRALRRFDPNAPHIERLLANTRSRKVVAGGSFEIHAKEYSGTSTKKNESKEVPQGSPRIKYSASSLAERRQDSHLFSW
ncbi:hypothetical protein RB195_008946 [Necator americanus]|uniref:Uncharacterized protein n=1 Tax=Necator americanus TaxID=51031 RepID=A0ABR1CRW3_NECAM